MAHREGHREASRARILASAGRGFRALGFGGLGVDGLAKAAGVTSGAFYAHFPSKAAAFRDAVSAGMDELRDGIAQFQRSAKEGWRDAFIAFYLGERRTCDIGEACALQALTGEVERGDAALRADYTKRLDDIVNLVAAGPAGDAPDPRRADAIALLALLAGGVSIARAVNDVAFSAEIAAAVRRAADSLGDGGAAS